MKMRSSQFLGLAVGDKSIACVELAIAGDHREVRHAATFLLEEGALNASRTAATGQAFTAFLRKNGFAASRAVVGVPARWLLAVERDLPPVAEAAASAMLRLQAERLGVSETGEMVFDYAGHADTSAAKKVLLVGIPKNKLSAIDAVLDAAKIDILAVAPSSLTLACSDSDADASGHTIILSRQGAELVLCSHGTPRLLRHITTPTSGATGPVALGPLASELSRTLAMSGGNGNGAAGKSRGVVLWDGVGLSKDQFTDLSNRSGSTVNPGNAASMLRVSASTSNGSTASTTAAVAAGEYAPAIALALAGADRRKLPLDFKRSRLSPPKVKRISNTTLYGSIAGVLALAGLIWLYVSVSNLESEALDVNTKIKNLVGEVKTADASIATTNYGRAYFDKRTPVLDCLLEITRTLRPEDPLWANGFSIKSNGTITLSGRAANQEIVNEVVKRLLANKRFSKVSTGNMTMEPAKGREPASVTFNISFTYNPLVAPTKK